MSSLREFQEKPLEYWEEYSVLRVIPAVDDFLDLQAIPERLKGISWLTVENIRKDKEQHALAFEVNVNGETYQGSAKIDSFSLYPAEYEREPGVTERECEALLESRQALMFMLRFGKDPRASYHIQMKLALALVPLVAGIYDESAECFLPLAKALMIANSKAGPGAEDLYRIQAVGSVDDPNSDEIWLHTHGLARCGVTELEILQSNTRDLEAHAKLMIAYAGRLLDEPNSDPREKVKGIGRTARGDLVMVTCLSWTKALALYPLDAVGGAAYRKNAHNTRTSPLLLLYGEGDETPQVKKVGDVPAILEDHMVYFSSETETAHARAIARERFDRFREMAPGNRSLVKICLEAPGTEEGKEYIWFELCRFEGEKFLAKLMQEPYAAKDIHEGDERWYTEEDVADWRVYLPDLLFTPGNVYVR